MVKPTQTLSPADTNSLQWNKERADLALLTSKRAGEMLRLAFANTGILRSWNVHQIHHRPGAGVSVGYSIIIDAAHPFERRDLYVVASTARISEEKVLEVEGKRLRLGETIVNIWEFPHDPELPALHLACDVDKMSNYLGEPVELELLSYRPTRRAVVRVEREKKAPLFVKTIRPKAQAEFEERLNLMHRAGVKCPRIYAREVGVVMMTALEGVPFSRILARSSKRTNAAQRLTKEKSRELLHELEQILDSLPITARGFSHRPAWVERCEHYAAAAALALPEAEKQCHLVSQNIRYLLSRADFGAQVATHGDFYEANIYVNPQTFQISGLLDLDSLGPGYRAHDWGCLLGHMSVLPTLAPNIYDGVQEIIDDWVEILRISVDEVALAAAAAGTALSLVAGARKSRTNWSAEANNRLTAAQSWIERGISAL